ncbi:MAG: tryptophan--tRNA ligase [Clostridia bacterium]|nr:tryptophan--tRNA ligase [Clostridia bacterium]
MNNEKKVILTADRPSGNLHIGHYAGSLANRVRLQSTDEFEMFVMIADLQALTDHAHDVQKVTTSVEELMLDYLAVGLDPQKIHFVLQSAIPALYELPMFYANLVTQARLERNPTVKTEIKTKGYRREVPVGFVNYPISQAADITAFGASLVPVGADQAPMLEQTREIVATFNRMYGETLVMPEALIPEHASGRLVGIDGAGKMSKSLGNCIYIKDSAEELKRKINMMYTDPNHIKVSDPGKVEGNVVFMYLDAFYEDKKHLVDLKAQYRQGGLGDMVLKKLLFECLNGILAPMRERRAYYEQHMDEVRGYLREGTKCARKLTDMTLAEVKRAMGIYQI